ncbi:DUF4367 domain-containing protein [Dysosmobacter welbionis]
MAESNQTNKYAYLSRLSTKELEAILRADSESPNAVNDEAISYILEVIEQREHEHPSGSFPDVDSSWKEFQTIYNTPEGADQSLYPNEEEDVFHTLSVQKEAKQRRILRKPLLVAAIIVLLIASLTIPVAGYGNLLEMIGSWTADQFTFITSGYRKNSGPAETDADKEEFSDPQIGVELRQVLQEYGITESVVPSWLPDGFELIGDVSVQEYPNFDRLEFFAYYESGDNTCTLSVTKVTDPLEGLIYEKTLNSPEIYTVGSVNHYIVQNTDSIIVAWYVDDLECSINSTMPESDLKRVIDSIY